MSTHGPVRTAEPTPRTRMPDDIDSPKAKLVFHSLDAVGDATVDELSDRLGLKKITLYGVLDGLDRRGLVEKRGDRYVSVHAT